MPSKLPWLILPLFALLTACGLTGAEPGAAPSAVPAGAQVEAPSATVIVAEATPTSTPTPMKLEIAAPDPDFVALDFVADVCKALWTNNGQELNCPGDPRDLEAGFIDRVDGTTIEGGMVVDLPALLTIPAHNGSFGGIFGRYPPFEVQYGDSFRAILACQEDDGPCDVGFDLTFYDGAGRRISVPDEVMDLPLTVSDEADSTATILEIDLDFLSGKTVEFLLTARDIGGRLGSRALWIGPYIWRDPKGPHQETPSGMTPMPAATEEESDSIPGVISGMVDMNSAPPYLNDPGLGGSGEPVVVVFFNQDDYTWWWIHSTLTHPNYQMTVPTGRYTVVAYARGVGGEAYVTAGYTGQNPSCGEELALVTVGSNARVDDVVIADWNWSCGGTAYRPPKPDAIPLP